MKVFVGADHRGVEYKKKITAYLERNGFDFIDVGVNDSSKMCDYPKIACEVGGKVASVRNSRGILVCMSGIGQSIAANKIKGIYAALCLNVESAESSRRHNNANVLVFSSKFTPEKDIDRILAVWLNTEFDGGRHKRRVGQIKKIEKQQCDN